MSSKHVVIFSLLLILSTSIFYVDFSINYSDCLSNTKSIEKEEQSTLKTAAEVSENMGM